MDSASSFLSLIDERARKNIPQNIVYRTSMIITSLIDDTKANAKIPGYDTEYTLLNKTGLILAVGNNVIVESTGADLNNGLIVHKFGADSVNFESSLQAANLLTAIKTVDGSGSGLDADKYRGLKIQCGSLSITPVANTPTSGTVTFAEAFSVPPYVLVTAATGVPYTGVRMVSFTNPTTTTVDLVITRVDTTPTRLDWLAIGT